MFSISYLLYTCMLIVLFYKLHAYCGKFQNLISGISVITCGVIH